MAKVEGFTISDDGYYKIYKTTGLDVHYWKGLPVISVATKTRPKKQTSIASTRQQQTNQYFVNATKIWKMLTPTVKRFYNREAKIYDLTGKDLFYLLYLRLYDEYDLSAPGWWDFFIYWWDQKLTIDLLATLPDTIALVKFPWKLEPSLKYEKQRGHWKVCKRPPYDLKFGIIKQVLAYSNNTYNLTLNREAQWRDTCGSRTWYYSQKPEEVIPAIHQHIESNWPCTASTYLSYLSFAGCTLSHTQKHNLEASGGNMYSIYSLAFPQGTQYANYKRLIIEAVGKPIQVSTTNYPAKEVIAKAIMHFNNATLYFPATHPWAVFPQLPAGLKFASKMYITFLTPYYYAPPILHFPIPPIGKAVSENIYIMNDANNRFQFKIVKGPYFVFRYQFPNPDDEDQYAWYVWKDQNYASMRLSPVLSPKKAKKYAFKIPPPTLDTYYSMPYWTEYNDPQAGPRPIPSIPKADRTYTDKGTIQPTIPNGNAAIPKQWDENRKEHEARNPNERYWWNEPEGYDPY